MDNQQNDFPTVIGPDAHFKGELSFETGVRVLGSFEGQINTTGALHVAADGKLQADVAAGTITVEGEIRGNVAAQDVVELKNTARLQGDLRCGRLIVVDGAQFTGHCSVGEGAPAPATGRSERPRPAGQAEADET